MVTGRAVVYDGSSSPYRHSVADGSMIVLHRNDAVGAFPIVARSAQDAGAWRQDRPGPEPPPSPTENVMSKGLDRFLGLLAWPLAAFDAYIFVDYLRFKFTGDEGSVWLFTILTDWLGLAGHVMFLRIGVGSVALIAAILLFIPATQVVVADLALAIITGALVFHLVSPLGIEPSGD